MMIQLQVGSFQIFFQFSPRKLGKMSTLTSIFFQMGWFNHQPGNVIIMLKYLMLKWDASNTRPRIIHLKKWCVFSNSSSLNTFCSLKPTFWWKFGRTQIMSNLVTYQHSKPICWVYWRNLLKLWLFQYSQQKSLVLNLQFKGYFFSILHKLVKTWLFYVVFVIV